jgi:ribosomal protein S27AE
MFDNTPDDRLGLDSDSMDDIAYVLANTRRDIRDVVENIFERGFTNEIMRGVLKRLNQCEGCGLWMPTRLDRWVCTDCASRRWKLTDRAFLEAVGIRFDSDMERPKYK